ncbi:MAG: alpha/beta fold hydrolase [Xanthomonadales bacterium PRO6]|nr:Esterase EstD [Xanthomonadales bacterium]MCE7930414.1 alpha/beta fold hydrolase [Xanthomonadales bacterium PRO6]
MRTRITIGALLLPILASAAADCPTRATAVLQALDAGDWERAGSGFDGRMREALPADKLQAVWESLPAQVGKRLAQGEPRVAPAGGGERVTIPLQHEKAWLDLLISCAADGQVQGLFVRPGKAPAEPPAAPPADAPWRERELRVASAGLELPATLSVPRGQVHAGVVLVHGSGAHDRDETIGPNKPFRDLAHGLASHGIAALRYEKRSHAHPQSFVGKAYTVKEEVVDDAVAAIALLRTQPELAGKPVFVIGHSLGAMLAPRIATEAKADGMVLMAAPARSLTEMIPQQVRYIVGLDGQIDAAEQAHLDQILAGIAKVQAALAAPASEDSTPILGAPASYWRDLHHAQPFLVARAAPMPMLVLQGERDYQVTMKEDFQAWHMRMRGREGYSERSFATLGHLFTPASEKPGPADYEVAATMDAEVIATIVDWMIGRVQ